MNSATYSRWLFAFAATQAAAAIFTMLSYLGFTSAPMTNPAVWLSLATILGSGFAFVAYSRIHRPRSAPLTSEAPLSSEIVSPALAILRNNRIHCLVPLTFWSVLADLVVVYMTTHIEGLLLVALGPLWVVAGSYAASRISSRHRLSMIILAALLCGFFGAWLGSGGDKGTLLGFLWGCMAGGLASSYFNGGDASMSVASALIATTIFVGCTALIMGPDFVYVMENPSNFVRSGFPLFTIEAALILSGYLLHGALRQMIKK